MSTNQLDTDSARAVRPSLHGTDAMAEARANAAARFRQSSIDDRASVIERYAATLRKSDRANGSQGPTATGTRAGVDRIRRSMDKHASYWPITTDRCTISGGSQFDGASGVKLVPALYEGTDVPVPGVAAQYSAADATEGELALILLVGHGLSFYDHPAVGATPYFGLVEAFGQSAYVENFRNLAPNTPESHLGVVAAVELPAAMPFYLTPTVDGAFDGLVAVMGHVKLEVYATTPMGVVYRSTRKEFLDRAQSRIYQSSGGVTPMLNMGFEVDLPPGTGAVFTRVSAELTAVRTLAGPGTGPSGGFVGAIMADPDSDPGTGLWFAQNPGRAKVTILSNFCIG